MSKTSLFNPATRNCFRRNLDACWHDTVTCTSESSLSKILSDIIAASYQFLLTNDSTNLLQALKIAKISTRKFQNKLISCDDPIDLPNSTISLRLSIKFSDDKKKIIVKCFIQNGKQPLSSINTESKNVKKEYMHIYNSIIKLKEDYEQL